MNKNIIIKSDITIRQAMKVLDKTMGKCLLVVDNNNKLLGTLTDGDRQAGRLKAESVIDCKPTKESIQNAFKRLYSEDFQNILTTVENPYGAGNGTEKIMDVLKNHVIPETPKKEFYDL